MTIRDDILASGLMLFDGVPEPGQGGASVFITDGKRFAAVEYDPDKDDEETVLADVLAELRKQLN